ncbi:ABC transporter substrate-binding protein [Roseomonas sp. 18066]|uniref:ABC transporter substrate-binding protein n=1 Tax=Roseomonas sp. 18066 TaxID=2681412 RepID=UPI00135B0E3F|nr:extracellular solute-binding protein [Roseomonas sp. 18066]
MGKLDRRSLIGAAVLTAGLASRQARAAVPEGYPAGYADLVEAATQEGSLLVYSNMSAANWRPVLESFARRFPGIRVETLNLGGQAFDRYLAERATNTRTADLLAVAEPSKWVDLQRRGEILPYRSPEDAAWPAWSKPVPGYYTVSADPMTFLWNNSLVPEAKRPKTFDQAIALIAGSGRAWRNRITSYDPGASSFGFLTHHALVQRHGDRAWDWLQQVAEAGPRFGDRGGVIAEKVTTGEFAFAWFVSVITFWPRLADPARARILGWGFTEGDQALMPRGIAVPKGAGHVNAAKLLLDHTLSPEGQAAFGRGGLTPALPGLRPGDGVAHTYSSVVEAAGGEEAVFVVRHDPALEADYAAFVERWKRIAGR